MSNVTIDKGITAELLLEEINAHEVKVLLPIILFFGLILTLGLVGNALVLLVYTMRYKRSPARVYILFLASIDFLICLFGLPYHLIDLTHPYTYNNELSCKILTFIIGCLFHISIFGLIIIAVDRYLKICRPLGTLQLSYMGRKGACVASVICGLLLSWPYIVLYGPGEMETSVGNITGNACFFHTQYYESSYPLIFTIVTLCVCLISTFFLVVMYALICHHIVVRYKGSIVTCSNDAHAYDESLATDVQCLNRCTDSSHRRSPTESVELIQVRHSTDKLDVGNHILEKIIERQNSENVDMVKVEGNFNNYKSKFDTLANSDKNGYIVNYRLVGASEQIKIITNGISTDTLVVSEFDKETSDTASDTDSECEASNANTPHTSDHLKENIDSMIADRACEDDSNTFQTDAIKEIKNSDNDEQGTADEIMGTMVANERLKSASTESGNREIIGSCDDPELLNDQLIHSKEIGTGIYFESGMNKNGDMEETSIDRPTYSVSSVSELNDSCPGSIEDSTHETVDESTTVLSLDQVNTEACLEICDDAIAKVTSINNPETYHVTLRNHGNANDACSETYVDSNVTNSKSFERISDLTAKPFKNVLLLPRLNGIANEMFMERRNSESLRVDRSGVKESYHRSNSLTTLTHHSAVLYTTCSNNGDGLRIHTSRVSMAPSLNRSSVQIKPPVCRQHYKITKIMLTITIVFVLSYTPALVVTMWSTLNPGFWDVLTPTETLVCEFLLRFYLINNVCNPFIYGFWDKRFKREIVTSFRKIRGWLKSKHSM